MPYVGIDGKLYYNDGTYDSPDWVEITRAIDVSLNIEQTAVDVSSRRSRWRAFMHGLKDGELTFGYRVTRNATDPVKELLDSMLLSGQTVADFAVMDGDIETPGSAGLRFFGMLTSDNLNQALEDGAAVEYTVKPTYVEDDQGNQVEPVILEIEE